jgi:hypothetical protein
MCARTRAVEKKEMNETSRVFPCFLHVQMPTERELRELLEAREGSAVPPPTVFSGDVSLCPVLNGSGGAGGAGGSAALLQHMARASGGGGGAGGAGGEGAVIGYEQARAKRAARWQRQMTHTPHTAPPFLRGRSITALC